MKRTPPRKKGLTALDGLTVFLYLLMRDEVPTGTVAEIAETIATLRREKKSAEFSSEELAALANKYARRILHKK